VGLVQQSTDDEPNAARTGIEPAQAHESGAPTTGAFESGAPRTGAHTAGVPKVGAPKAGVPKAAARKIGAQRASSAKKPGKKGVAGKVVAARAAIKPAAPTYDVERDLLAQGAITIAGVDEVGRGAWAGPVLVAAAVTDLSVPPTGLTDSKLLTAKRREEVAAAVDPWVRAYAFGIAEAEEIDELGMTAALRLAAVRALDALPVRPDAIVLDGKHDFLGTPWNVRCVIKGDQSCVSVAAASVLAKVHRDAMMAGLGEAYPAYAFESNAGYPAPVHRAALAEHGPTPLHRMSWAYWDDLPAWRHLKRVRPQPAAAGQLGFDLD
jgi:ribonuclease HII